MKIAFIDHAYHQKTRSSVFFKDALLSGHEVDLFWDARWIDGTPTDAAGIAAGNYDLVIVWQSEQSLVELAQAGLRDMVFVPMWDSCWALPDSWWQGLAGVRVVSFCHALHERARRNGLISLYVQYFPDPEELAPTTTFDSLRGFLWQRRTEVTWTQVLQLVGDTKFSRMHLHLALDPGVKVDNALRDADKVRYNITESDWFPRREDLEALLSEFNVYFASRPSEGIGFSFIEALAKGMCVVAIDNPSMNEYITDGVNGLLWKLNEPRRLDFSRAAEFGRRGREAAMRGYRHWLKMLPALLEFVFTPTDRLAPDFGDYTRFRGGTKESVIRQSQIRRAFVLPAAPASVPGAAAQGGMRTQGLVRRDISDVPLMTVATVTLNCRDVVEATLQNILDQDYPNLEVIVVDGGSTDGTLGLIREYDSLLDFWISQKDKGPYDAMNKAARLAHGRYILFMNAGDWFVGTDALSRAVSGTPNDADFIIGHHIYRRVDGSEELHRAADFETTWRRLQAGDLDGQWLSGIPGHQATLTRTELLRGHPYDNRYAMAADHDFMYRQRARGARFYHSGEIVAVYTGGGMTWNNQIHCIEDWWEITARYSGARAATNFFLPMKSKLLTSSRKSKLREKSGFVSRLADVRRLHREVRELRLSGLFSEQWYFTTYPDVAQFGMDPIVHYLKHGADELRNPSPFFDTRFYLALYGDVRRAGVNPLLHYLRYGAGEGRVPNNWFDPKRHLQAQDAVRREPPLVTFIRNMAQASSDEAVRIWVGPSGSPTK